ncbi:chemotaxis protein CheW [Cognatilysobacter bugurensis]|uniref:Chemotaxis protein CheW n=1 Tax=Cognatilysobacter bugurensis TaxID=543356 RepID=A0A918T063_9GAMM|nr:chemotaxis protein CheW [Lysobacter bugurensis]GHA80918.1 chemotaxis protein CheW [Lysobacter bugurensis]
MNQPKHNAADASPASHDEAMQYLTFALGTEMFASDIRGIKEIIEYAGLTTVPMMPAFIRGVINLRGAVVPVIDLSVRFGRAPTMLTRRTCIVIMEAGSDDERQDIGVVVDAVSEVLEIAPSQIEPPPSFGARIRSEFISGMALLDAGFAIVLDVQRVLSVEEMAGLADLAQSGITHAAA